MTHKRTILLLVGPTASGKSALAIKLAKARPTVIINADAMQMVADLRLITARPSVEDEAGAEHVLYGVLPATTPTSVAVWLALIKPEIERAWGQGKLPLLVGGTGMYISSLLNGISRIPAISEEVRQRVRGYSIPLRGRAGVGPQAANCSPNSDPHLTSPLQGEALHRILSSKDPLMAAKLKPGDTQRILRALEVIEATGQSLDTWQKLGNDKIITDAEFISFSVETERKILYQRIDQRFDIMMQNGALEEVKAFQAKNLSPDLPITRAVGVPELTAYLTGEMTYDEAITKAKQHSRNYAKRQMTWIRNQMPEAQLVQNENDILTKC